MYRKVTYQRGRVRLLAGGVISLTHCVGALTAGGGLAAPSLPATHLSPCGGSLPWSLTRLLQGKGSSSENMVMTDSVLNSDMEILSYQ